MEEQLHRCYKCKREDIPREDMAISGGKIRNVCRKCRCIEEQERRSRRTPEKIERLKIESKQKYREQVELISSLDEFKEEDLEFLINKWVIKNKNRVTEKRFKQRKVLDSDNLKFLCYKARELFPYITFNNKRDGRNSQTWASIDRVDPTKPYSDDNIIVVPLWLNSAKLDSSYQELFDLFDLVNRDEFFRFVNVERLSLSGSYSE